MLYLYGKPRHRRFVWRCKTSPPISTGGWWPWCCREDVKRPSRWGFVPKHIPYGLLSSNRPMANFRNRSSIGVLVSGATLLLLVYLSLSGRWMAMQIKGTSDSLCCTNWADEKQQIIVHTRKTESAGRQHCIPCTLSSSLPQQEDVWCQEQNSQRSRMLDAPQSSLSLSLPQMLLIQLHNSCRQPNAAVQIADWLSLTAWLIRSDVQLSKRACWLYAVVMENVAVCKVRRLTRLYP